MLTAETFHRTWNRTDNRQDALFWANWLMEPGRFYLPTDRPPRESWQMGDMAQSMPQAHLIETNIRTLMERLPTSLAGLDEVMATLRVRDALPETVTKEQQHAGEALALAGELEALYAFGVQLHERL